MAAPLKPRERSTDAPGQLMLFDQVNATDLRAVGPAPRPVEPLPQVAG